ncbi:hypothetical protein LME02_06930 [Leuconostoc mesenteroides subsp. dextranicum]|nr:hypothetical protein LME02_06930 [Leuconostoc mesenteroides subsp. dextranicum]
MYKYKPTTKYPVAPIDKAVLFTLATIIGKIGKNEKIVVLLFQFFCSMINNSDNK